MENHNWELHFPSALIRDYTYHLDFLKWNLKETNSKPNQQLKDSFGGKTLMIIELCNINFMEQILT